MEDLSDFERGQIVGAQLAGAFVIETATLLGISRATVSKVMSAYTNHGKTTSAKINIERERSSYIEKDCFEKTQNCSTGDRTAELNIHLDPVSTKAV
jgi:predicted transcriptional regulator